MHFKILKWSEFIGNITFYFFLFFILFINLHFFGYTMLVAHLTRSTFSVAADTRYWWFYSTTLSLAFLVSCSDPLTIKSLGVALNLTSFVKLVYRINISYMFGIIHLDIYHFATKSVKSEGYFLLAGNTGTGSWTICCNSSKMDRGVPSGGNGNLPNASSIKVIPNDHTSDFTE